MKKKNYSHSKFHCYNLGQAMGIRSSVAVTTSPWKRQFPADRTNIFPECSGIGEWNTLKCHTLKYTSKWLYVEKFDEFDFWHCFECGSDILC